MKEIDLTNLINDGDVAPSPVYSERLYPWEGISTPVRGITHIDAALDKAGLNYKVIQVPVTVEGKVLKERVANIRNDTREFIEVVSRRYVPFQNNQAFAFLEGALGSGAMELQNAGQFGFDSVFIQARVGKPVPVLGDIIMPYALIRNSHDGTSSVKVCFTPTRVVCRNTLSLALKTAPRIWYARHVSTIKDRMEELKDMLTMSESYFGGVPEMAEKMNEINVTNPELAKIFEAMFPLKKDAGNVAINNVKAAVTEIMTIYLESKDLSRFRGSAWGFYNAVADYTTHHVPKETANWKENRLNRVAVEGDFRLDTAQKMLLAVPA